MRRSTQIAIFSGAGLGPTEKTVTGNAPLTISDAVNDSIKALTIYGHTEIGASVGDNGLTVTSCGKNLFEIKRSGTGVVKNGLTIDFDRINGIVTLSGTASSNVEINLAPLINDDKWSIAGGTHSTFYLPVGDYSVSDGGTGLPDGARLTTNNIDGQSAWYNAPFNFTVSDASYPITFGIFIPSGMTLDNVIVKPMIRKASESATFEPYTGSTATITTALPLKSNGNVRDELDYPANKVITRIDSNGDVLDTPVETALSASEIAAFQSLNTYEGTTNIFVTDDPSISVTYMTPRTITRATKKRTARKKK